MYCEMRCKILKFTILMVVWNLKGPSICSFYLFINEWMRLRSILRWTGLMIENTGDIVNFIFLHLVSISESSTRVLNDLQNGNFFFVVGEKKNRMEKNRSASLTRESVKQAARKPDRENDEGNCLTFIKCIKGNSLLWCD